ncbi:type II toxin-antitoxin system PemK/MazF family toxin [Nocardia jiangxiensis]|uniref:Type II toxin-antitoxin system PemK/MazF family toxin n=1 Tax=Nocardia jiangxiensis TaxID=282685 RepID=A0ABW6SAV5_9NOCA
MRSSEALSQTVQKSTSTAQASTWPIQPAHRPLLGPTHTLEDAYALPPLGESAHSAPITNIWAPTLGGLPLPTGSHWSSQREDESSHRDGRLGVAEERQAIGTSKAKNPTTGIRFTQADAPLVARLAKPGETKADVIRRAPHELERREWVLAAQQEAERIDANAERPQSGAGRLVIRAAIYQVDLGQANRGREQRGKRYRVVLSEIDWSLVTVVPTSTSAQDQRFRPRIELLGDSTLLLVDQIRSLDTSYVGDMVGYLSQEDTRRLEHAVRLHLGV